MDDINLTALRVEPGCIYVIEADRMFSFDETLAIEAQAAHIKEKLGVTFIILDSGLRVARSLAPMADTKGVHSDTKATNEGEADKWKRAAEDFAEYVAGKCGCSVEDAFLEVAGIELREATDE